MPVHTQYMYSYEYVLTLSGLQGLGCVAFEAQGEHALFGEANAHRGGRTTPGACALRYYATCPKKKHVSYECSYPGSPARSFDTICHDTYGCW